MKKILIPLACIIVAGGLLFGLLIISGAVVLDHSAERGAEGSVYWNGVWYQPCGGEYTEGRTIAMTGDGWRLNQVGEDDTHTFLVMRSFLDQHLVVRADYEIPASGEITTAVWGDSMVRDKTFFDLLTVILGSAVPDFQYETEGIFMLTDTQRMRQLYIGYQGCPVATKWIGYLGTIDGKWYLTMKISEDQHNPDGSWKPYTVWCYTIPEEYAEQLEACYPGTW